MNTIGDRLRHARETAHNRFGRDYKMMQGELAEKIGATQAAISNIERNKVLSMRDKLLFAAAEYLKVSPIWLSTGEGDMDDNDDVFMRLRNQTGGVRLIHPGSCRRGIDAPCIDTLNVTRKIHDMLSEEAFFTICTDNGMDPMMRRGDLVLVDPGMVVHYDTLVLAKHPDFSLPIVRRLVADSTGRFYRLQPLNTNLPELSVKKTEQIIGTIIEYRCWPDSELNMASDIPGNKQKITDITSA